MTTDDIAASVLESIGGITNLVSNTLCMTRLRLAVANPNLVDKESLSAIPDVLGTVGRGVNGIEVVFSSNAVGTVYEALCKLTGKDPDHEEDATERPDRQGGSLRVQILGPAMDEQHVTTRRASAYESSDPAAEGAIETKDLLARMLRLSEEDDELNLEVRPESEGAALTLSTQEPVVSKEATGSRLLVINGPNINLLGIREPDIYGKTSFSQLLELCKRTAKEAGFVGCVCFQSNHEGDLVDAIQDAYGNFDGIVLNPAAYTHTSVALLDALKAVSIPAIEVHISKVDEREDFRQTSYVRQACLKTISGLGIEGYAKAIRDMAAHLKIETPDRQGASVASEEEPGHS